MGISAVPSEIKSPAAPAAARGRVAIQGWGAGPPWVSVSRSCSRGSHWPPHLWACAHGVQLAVLAVRTKAAETRPPSLRQGQNRVTEPPVSPLSACTLRTHTCHRGGLVSVVCFGFLSPSWRISAPGALSSLSHSVLLWGPLSLSDVSVGVCTMLLGIQVCRHYYFICTFCILPGGVQRLCKRVRGPEGERV